MTWGRAEVKRLLRDRNNKISFVKTEVRPGLPSGSEEPGLPGGVLLSGYLQKRP